MNIDDIPEMRQSEAASQTTVRSYAINLKKEIDEERKMREELERQIEELKKFNKSISSKLGLNIGK